MHKIYTTFRSKESQEKINSIVRLEQGITLKTANINSWVSKFWQIHDLNKKKKKPRRSVENGWRFWIRIQNRGKNLLHFSGEKKKTQQEQEEE